MSGKSVTKRLLFMTYSSFVGKVEQNPGKLRIHFGLFKGKV